MAGFLIEYNRRTGEHRVTEFAGKDGHRAALQQRLKLEHERRDPDIEIASLNSDSLATVEKTHARYFKTSLVAS